MKILDIKLVDTDGYGDWLKTDKATEFVTGGYTHIRSCGEINEAELYGYHNNNPLVSIGVEVNIKGRLEIK